MTKNEVIKRLCTLLSEVGDKVYKNRFAHDCFGGLQNKLCENEGYDSCNYCFQGPILEFIEKVVKDRIEEIEKEGRGKDDGI